MSCPICLEDFKNKDEIINLLCNHIFHKVCIDRWKLCSKICPYCRTEMEYSYKLKTNFCNYNIINKIIKKNISVDIDEDRLVIKHKKNIKDIEFMMIGRIIKQTKNISLDMRIGIKNIKLYFDCETLTNSFYNCLKKRIKFYNNIQPSTVYELII